MPSVIFGTNTCFAVKRWPEPSEWTRIAAKIGLSHVQFSFDLLDPWLGGTPDMYAETRRACEEQGIAIGSAFTGLIGYSQNLLGHPSSSVRARSRQWFQAAIDATAALGARGMGGHIGSLSVKDFEDQSSRSRRIDCVVQEVIQLSDRAANRGLAFLLWETMPVRREYPSAIHEAEELMARLEGVTAVPVELCVDVGHVCAAGASGADRDPYEWLMRLGRFTRVVHLQQTDGLYDRHWPFTARFNEQGIIDPQRIVDVVREFDRDDIELMLEPMHAFEATDQQVVEDLAESVSFWEPWLDRVGVKLRPERSGLAAGADRGAS